MLHSLKHYKVLHERVVLATVTVADTPFVPTSRRVSVDKLGKGFFSVRFLYGFFDIPNLPDAFLAARSQGLSLDVDTATFFLGRETLVPGDNPSLPALAGGAIHVAGVERSVAGALLSIAAGTRGRTGHPAHNLNGRAA